jgi:hypothetical protein
MGRAPRGCCLYWLRTVMQPCADKLTISSRKSRSLHASLRCRGDRVIAHAGAAVGAPVVATLSPPPEKCLQRFNTPEQSAVWLMEHRILQRRSTKTLFYATVVNSLMKNLRICGPLVLQLRKSE